MKKPQNKPLTPSEQKILDALEQNSGRVVLREDLHAALETEALSNVVDVHIKNLRRKRPDITIEMVRGLGYSVQ